MMKKILFAFFAAAILAAPIFSLEVPPLTGPVMDTAKIMTASARAELEKYLLAVEQNSSAQIAVLTIPSLQGEVLEDYSLKVAREWQLGGKEDNKGVLLLVAYEEHKIRIEVGYGAEAELTDTKCGLIIRNIIAPKFKEADYSAGIEKGVKAIAGILSADPDGNQVDLSYDGDEPSAFSVLCGLIFFVLYYMMFTGRISLKFPSFRWFGRKSSGGASSSGSYRHSSYRSGGSSGGSYSRSSYSSRSGSSRSYSGHGGGFGGGGSSGGW